MVDAPTPMNIQAEQATLGAMLISPQVCADMLSRLDEADFPHEAHRKIFSSMKAVADSGVEVDVVTIADELRKRGVLAECGGGEYITRIIGEVPTTIHAYRYADIIAETALRRKLQHFGAELHERAGVESVDAGELLSWAASRVGDAATMRQGNRGAKPMRDLTDSIFADLMRKLDEPRHTSAVRLGIPQLDHYMGGLRGYGLVVPRGFEKSGKSMVGMNAALTSALCYREVASEECVVCYLLEGQEVWVERAAAWLAEVNSNIFTPAQFALEHERRAVAEVEPLCRELPLYLTGSLFDVDEIIMDVRRVALKQRVGFVLVDYAQLIQGGDGSSGTERMEYCANKLAALAGELGCVLMVPSQMTEGDGGRHAKWARAWDEAATLVFDVERGEEGAKREDWIRSEIGRLRLHAARRRPPFAVHHVIFDLRTGHITDAVSPKESAGYAITGA